MRLLTLFLILSAMPLFGQSSDNSPLKDPELRDVHGYLLELVSARKDLAAYEAYLTREEKLRQREAASYEEAIRVKEDAVALAKEQAAFWKQQYEVVTKKPGARCKFLRVISFGIHRCN
jgi:hypothetical protein